MFCYVRGVNHNSAPVDVREELAFGPGDVSAVLDMFSKEGAQESFILATCNRTEFYVAGNPPEELWGITDRVMGKIASVRTASRPEYWYDRHDRGVVEHLFRVAGGLDSMLLGEPEVLGQVKSAFDVARDAGTVGVFYNEVFKRCCHVAKRVRTETALGVGPVSVASVTREVLSRDLGSLRGRRILLLGTGEIAKQVGQQLADESLEALFVASRTPERAKRVAEMFGGTAIMMDDAAQTLAHCDAVVAATSSTSPIVTREHVAHVTSSDRETPLVLVDLAHPRNIHPSVRDLPSVRIYAIDDLRSLIEANLVRRRAEVPIAEEIIAEETGRLAQWHTSLGVASSLKSFRRKFEVVRQHELERLRTRLSAKEWDAVDEASRRILAKFLHTPTLALKSLDVDDPEDHATLETIRELFDLPKNDPHSPH